MNENSKYQNIKILSSPSLGNCLLLDNLQNLAEVDLSYTQGLMNFGKVDYRDKEILILGGGDGGLLHELLKGWFDEQCLSILDRKKRTDKNKRTLSL